MGVKAIYFSVQDVGKHVKKSKKRFIWKFQIDRDEHVLEMFNSYLSGKKQIILDGRTLHEVQKVTSSFQFPFQIKSVSCMVVQHGEQFELRINNQVFSHLYNQEKMKREFQFEGEGGNGNKGYDDDEEPTRFSGFGSKNEDRYEKPKQSTYDRSQTFGGTRVKGWDDEEPQRREEPKRQPYGSKDDSDEGEGGFGFANAFSKFDTKSNQQQSQQSRNSNNNDPFDSYGNKYSVEQSRKSAQPTQQNRGFEQQTQKQQSFGFDDFQQKPKQTQPSFGFDDFQAPPKQQQQQQQQQQQSNQRPAQGFSGFESFDQKPKMQHASTMPTSDLLDLDFGGNSQPSQPQKQNQNAGFGGDFFAQQSQPQPNRPSQPMNQSQNQRPSNTNNLNDLMGLEFGSANPGNSQTSNTSGSVNMSQKQASDNNMNFFDDAPQTQSQPQNQSQSQPQKKKDLWSTDLVSLDPSEALTGGNKKGNEYDYGMSGNMGYNNNNMRGPGNMNQPQGNYGYNGGYGGNNNYNNNMGMGGMGGMGMNMGMGGNQYQNTGYGGNNNYNNNMNAYGNNPQGGMGMNAGYGNPGMNMNASQNPPANNASTPFDFI